MGTYRSAVCRVGYTKIDDKMCSTPIEPLSPWTKDFVLPPTPKANSDVFNNDIVFLNNNQSDLKLLSPAAAAVPGVLKVPPMLMTNPSAIPQPPPTLPKATNPAAAAAAAAVAAAASLRIDEDELLRAIYRATAAASSSSNSCGSICSCSSICGGGDCDSLLLLDGSNPRYKTEMCRNFKEKARCVYGDQCQFAHGRRELREVVRNSKYKTKHCQKYWVTGYCAYGPRCNFLHNEMTPEEEQQHLLFRRKLRSASGGGTGPVMICPAVSRFSSSSEGSLTPPGDGDSRPIEILERPPPKKVKMEPLVKCEEPAGDIFSAMERWNNDLLEEKLTASGHSQPTATEIEP